MSSALKDFYRDLTNPDYTTSFAVYHRRYSTNTTPKWPLAQPMRFLGHNGKISLFPVFRDNLLVAECTSETQQI